MTFLAELPDKTSLAALTLAAQHRAFPVWLGAVLAFTVQTALAVSVGTAFTRLSPMAIRVGSGLLFLAFSAYYALGIWRARRSRAMGALRVAAGADGEDRSREGRGVGLTASGAEADGDDDADADAARVRSLYARARRLDRHVVLQAAVIIFFAEFGDLTQVALVAFAARFRQPFLVFGAGLFALALAAAVSSGAGQRLGHILSPARMQIVASFAMGLMGVLTLLGWGVA